MPAVKLLPDEKIEEIRTLRRRGFTIRIISELTGIPRATVHHYVRGERVRSSNPLLVDAPTEVPHLGVHLPFGVVCPVCGEEQPHVTFCLDCGAAWMGTCGHGGEVVDGRHHGIDLKQLHRTEGDGKLYVFPLEPEEESESWSDPETG